MRWLDGVTDSMGMTLVSSGSWRWTGRPGMLQFIGLQRSGLNRATEHQAQLRAPSSGGSAHRVPGPDRHPRWTETQRSLSSQCTWGHLPCRAPGLSLLADSRQASSLPQHPVDKWFSFPAAELGGPRPSGSCVAGFPRGQQPVMCKGDSCGSGLVGAPSDSPEGRGRPLIPPRRRPRLRESQ